MADPNISQSLEIPPTACNNSGENPAQTTTCICSEPLPCSSTNPADEIGVPKTPIGRSGSGTVFFTCWCGGVAITTENNGSIIILNI